MENNYLIFRTDRLGDFLVSAVLIKSIKKNDPSSNITLITSNKNHFYAKNFSYIDEIIFFKNNFFSKLKLIFRLRKDYFHNIIIHDNKRSKFIASFIRFKNKLIVENQENFSHIEIIKMFLKKMNFLFFDDALNILNDRYKLNTEKNFLLIHFDEKWIYKDYINKFINIEPNENELFDFINRINSKSNLSLTITSGNKLPAVLKNILPKIKKLNINVHEKLNFMELEKVTSRSKILISCHGAISHIAAALNIKQIDIIDKSYNYNRWTNHFRNYNFLYRENFSTLANKITQML